MIYTYTGSILAGTGQLSIMNIVEGTAKSPSNMKIQGFYSLEELISWRDQNLSITQDRV